METAREAMLRRLLMGMTLLTRTRSLATGTLGEAFRDVLKMAARTLEVQRASLWFFDPQQSFIQCACLYDEAADGFTQGQVIVGQDCPAYFQELQRGRVVAAEDACMDPRTLEFRSVYLEPMGISSMLDVPVKRGDHLVGVVCHEHVGPSRTWLEEEVQFAAFVSSLISLVLDFHGRLAAEGKRVP